jgi:hypothetical protein
VGGKGVRFMNYRPSPIIVVVLLVASAAASVQAQINSDPPPLQGQKSYHLYSVPGVIANGPVETFFACTNTTDATIRVGVEIFGFAGGGPANDPSGSSVDVAAGGTAMFGTSATVWVFVDSDLAPGFISRGSARVLSTKRSGVICTVFLADPGNVPPTSMADLKVVKKTKQKGE